MQRVKISFIAIVCCLFHTLSLSATSWTPAIRISPPPVTGQDANNTEVSMNNSGNAVAVWRHQNGTAIVIEAATYNGVTWSSPVTISPSVSGQDANEPQVTMNNNGTAIAIWQRSDGTTTVIETSTYNGVTWGPVTTLSPSIAGSAAGFPQVSINDSGNAIAVWHRFGGAVIGVEYSTYNGSTWSPFGTITSIVGQPATVPKLSMNSSGNAVTVWTRNIAGTNIIQASTYNGSVWSSIVTISPSTPGLSAGRCNVTMNDSGIAIAVWRHTNGTVNRVETATYNGSTWGSAATISPPSTAGQNAENPDVVMNNSGNAIAAWDRNLGTVIVIEATTYNGSTWSSTIATLSPSSSAGQDAVAPQLTMNESGNAIAAWERFNGTVSIVEAASFNGASWDPAVTLSPPSTAGQDAVGPGVSMNDSGNAVAVWERNNGTASIIEAASGFASSGRRFGKCGCGRRCLGGRIR